MEETNILKNWTISVVGENDVRIYGTIYNDIKGRFPDGTYIHTSQVLKINFVTGVVETKNSVYHLRGSYLKGINE